MDNIRSKVYRKTDVLLLPLSIVDSFRFFRKFADHMREVPMKRVIEPPPCTVVAVSDASSLGGGFMLGNLFASYPFRKEHLGWHINQKEAHVILSSMYTLRKQLTGQTVLILMD
eukprot:144538_1